MECRGQIQAGKTGRYFKSSVSSGSSFACECSTFFGKMKRCAEAVPYGSVLCVTFEPLHNFYLEISKLLKNCSVGFFGSATLCSREVANVRGGITFVSFKGNMLQACNEVLMSLEKVLPVTGLRVNF